ncbi:3,4-dihydroxy-2-butanone-4-phosphate synthase [Rhodococcus oxybenzonivorans]|uniref:3,4-dihydroxy-2-butanone-4-phosphate synthase n=1 Tax=Rhodococcus oxybenzonivorans TaxID=1990687 RepID=UPI002953BE48|nr:3,4-dihydroxy-2-butanone-4-phosphate synthase [Rhodococcus oxybenzonivorans]MDV7351572.1 3,4-dihydroxy-2-butanone-4-phosphate synthase [Rhodococcus oxybenzonivorans]
MTDVCDVKKRIESATNALTTGRPALIVSGADDQEVADVLIPAALASPRWTAWAVRYTSGLLCAAMRSTRADELELPAMVRGNGSSTTTPAFGVGVDAVAGVGTGISATDRSRTARVLASPQTRPVDLTRPGHVLPLRTASRGVLERRNSAEAAVDLCEIAGLSPVALTATLLGDDGTLLQGTELAAFAQVHGVPVVQVQDVVHYRLHHGDGHVGRVRQTATRIVDVPDRCLRVVDFDDELTGAHHTAFLGSTTPAAAPTVYIVFECSHRDPLAPDCGCRREFETRRIRIAAEGGIIVYLRSNPRPANQYTVQGHELAQGSISSILTHLGFTTVIVSGWPGDQHPTSARALDLTPTVRNPAYKTAASL